MSTQEFENRYDDVNFEEQPKTASMRDKLYDASSRLRDRAADMTRMAGQRIDDTRRSAADGLRNTASEVRQSSTGMSNPTLSSAASKVADGLERSSVYLREGGMDAARSDVEKLVREKPAHTLIGALAIGFIAGKLLSRR